MQDDDQALHRLVVLLEGFVVPEMCRVEGDEFAVDVFFDLDYIIFG